MIGRHIQSIEAVPLGFDIGTLGKRKTHSSENLSSALVHLMKRMQRTNLVWRSRKRDVDARKRVALFLATGFFAALLERSSNGVARLVEQLTNDRAFLFAERFHPLAPCRDAAALSEIFYADAFERFLVARSFNLAQRIIAQLFQRVHGFR